MHTKRWLMRVRVQGLPRPGARCTLDHQPRSVSPGVVPLRTARPRGVPGPSRRRPPVGLARLVGTTPRLDRGFTLIELATVILIMGILTAAAYPAFSAVQNSAFDAEAKANAQNALTLELRYYYQHLTFLDAGSCHGGNLLDPNLPWGPNGSQNETAGNPKSPGSVVVVLAGTLNAVNEFQWPGGFCPSTATVTDDDALVEDLSASGNCFYIAYNMSVSPPVTGYAESKGPAGASKCIDTNGAGVLEFPTTAPSSGTAGAHPVPDDDATGITSSEWYQSF